MATITIDIPNGQAVRLQAALERELSLPPGTVGLAEAKGYIIQNLKDITLYNERQAYLEAAPITEIEPT